ncbi:hypothetical protein CF319_g5194 [Tilletia indica]|nr:hypothetical protein CF319_g5194 [Tilletia indica]
MDSILSQLTVESISTHLRGTGDDPTVQQAVHPVQIEHRLEIARRLFGSASSAAGLDINKKRVLEVGCGQGDMSIVLAEMVGEGGHVVAIDPAPLTYGAPMNLGQAQGVLKSSAVGSRLTFLRADVPTFFSSSSPAQELTSNSDLPFEAAVLAHCIFYFPSEAELLKTLTTLRRAGDIKHLCLAEWTLNASNPTAVPHLLAILAQSFLPKAEANVQTIFSPTQLKRLAESAGWKLKSESVITNPTLQDGRWEVDMTLDFQREREEELKKSAAASSAQDEDKDGEKTRNLKTFSTFCDSIRAHLPDPAGSAKGITCVDVWTAVFEAA